MARCTARHAEASYEHDHDHDEDAVPDSKSPPPSSGGVSINTILDGWVQKHVMLTSSESEARRGRVRALLAMRKVLMDTRRKMEAQRANQMSSLTREFKLVVGGESALFEDLRQLPGELRKCWDDLEDLSLSDSSGGASSYDESDDDYGDIEDMIKIRLSKKKKKTKKAVDAVKEKEKEIEKQDE